MGDSIPDVIVDFVFDQGLLHIALANIGDAPAYAVSVTFDPEVFGFGGSKSVSSMPLFRQTEFMPPHKEIRAFLDTSASYFTGKQPVKIRTTIKFSDRAGKKYSNEINHNLDIYRDIGYVPSDAPGHAVSIDDGAV
jgi:hypothetical protein